MRLACLAFGFLALACQNRCPETIVALPSTPSTTGSAPIADAGPVTDAMVAAILDDWHDAAAKADEKRYFDHFAEGAVFLGTDGKERWTLPQFREYAHPHFAKGKAWTMHASRREITFRGDTAWFDEDVTSVSLGAARGSGVLVRTGGTWQIAQYNLSIPIPNDRFAAARNVIEGQKAPCKESPRPQGNPGY